jgi:hypothetical protein
MLRSDAMSSGPIMADGGLMKGSARLVRALGNRRQDSHGRQEIPWSFDGIPSRPGAHLAPAAAAEHCPALTTEACHCHGIARLVRPV